MGSQFESTAMVARTGWQEGVGGSWLWLQACEAACSDGVNLETEREGKLGVHLAFSFFPLYSIQDPSS